jgi:hypothetical protein
MGERDEQHSYRVEPSASGENYSLLIMGDSNVEEDGGEVDGDGDGGDGVDGDGFEGTSLSQQGARTETSVPRNLSVAAAELRDFFWKIAGRSRVFASEGTYRQKGSVRGGPGPPHHRVVRPGVHPRHPLMWWVTGPPLALLWSSSTSGKNRRSGFVSPNSENISCVTFLKNKNNRK